MEDMIQKKQEITESPKIIDMMDKDKELAKKSMKSTAQRKQDVIEDPKIAAMRDRDKELVKGVFKFYEVPGGQMDFVYKKYKGQSVERYSMVDGQVYTIPLGVAKHLNNDCWYPIHAYGMDEHGKNAQKISQKVKRCGFQSLEFMDIEDFDRGGKQLIQIENMAIQG